MELFFTIVYSALALSFMYVVFAIGIDVYRDIKDDTERLSEEKDNADDKNT
jgi:hypothetical protein